MTPWNQSVFAFHSLIYTSKQIESIKRKISKLTFASSSLMEWSRKRPFVSYKSLKFSFVLGIDTTSATKDTVYRIKNTKKNQHKYKYKNAYKKLRISSRYFLFQSSKRNSFQLLQYKKHHSYAYPWNQLDRSCLSWLCYQPLHAFASEWQLLHGRWEHTSTCSSEWGSMANTPWPCADQMRVWEPNRRCQLIRDLK